ncbi:caspase domain-containing protein [Nonomuraea sp. NPDC050536]|uniref:caspase domain-containing protein n=1 Tax=Nonomuraea sp. NPDC050536 TaxID=3364366 RepID=UPI0037C787F5
MRLSNVAKSRAVLIGTSQYDAMPRLPAVENNLRALSGLLQDEELWGLPSDHCTVISNPTVAEEMIRPVKTAAAAAEDTLIVYFAGHGLLGMNGSDLYLTTPTADLDRIYNAVAYEHVRNELRSSRARNRIVILDCCYSGRALGGAMGPTEDNELIANMASVSGPAPLWPTLAVYTPPATPGRLEL